MKLWVPIIKNRKISLLASDSVIVSRVHASSFDFGLGHVIMMPLAFRLLVSVMRKRLWNKFAWLVALLLSYLLPHVVSGLKKMTDLWSWPWWGNPELRAKPS